MANGKIDLNRNAFCDVIFLKNKQTQKKSKETFCKTLHSKKKKKWDRKSIKVDKATLPQTLGSSKVAQSVEFPRWLSAMCLSLHHTLLLLLGQDWRRGSKFLWVDGCGAHIIMCPLQFIHFTIGWCLDFKASRKEKLLSFKNHWNPILC